jgi:hypothetical protein
LIFALIFYFKGWFDSDVAINPNLGLPPLITAEVFGFFGLVFGIELITLIFLTGACIV